MKLTTVLADVKYKQTALTRVQKTHAGTAFVLHDIDLLTPK